MTKRKRKPPPAWMYDRAMSPGTYANAIHVLGMTQVGAGRFFGVSPRTARRFVSGETKISPAIVMLLRGMLDRDEVPLVPRAPRRPVD